MTIKMLINATAQNELRIAVVEDGELAELDIEAAETSTLKGNIYKGVVHNVEGSLEAAFVDIGSHKQGFLPFSEIKPDQFYRRWSAKEAPRITDVVRRGQDIVVQVAKDAIGDKGVTLTTYLSLAGRYTVLMPGSDAGGISRKIEDDKMRKRIRAMASKLEKPEGCGFIVRTAGLNQTRVGIQKDLTAVSAQFEKVKKAAEIARAPSILYAEPDLVARTLRDFFNEDIDEVWIDTKEEYDAAVQYFEEVMPDSLDRLHYYSNPIPIFAYHHVEEQIESTFERRVGLPSGGSIVVDQTEALVAIDVNSGKNTREGGHEDTVFATNCEAAEEIARQLKLRDLGGIVVIDFIDMEMTKHKREVEKVLAEAAKDDKARYKISRINSKGLCVLTRQRIRQGMRRAFQHRCETCGGTGWRRSAESHSLSLVRRVEARLAQGGVGEARVTTHRETAEYLLNERRAQLMALERQYDCRIVVRARPDIDRGTDEVKFLSKGEVLAEITDKLPPREDRRRDRAQRKRRRAKKRREANVDTGEVAVSDVPSKSKSKSKRKRRRGDREEGGSEARGGEQIAARGDKSASAPEARGGSPTLEAKGDTTFTGRPSAEMLERLRAERQARRSRRENQRGPENPANGADAPAKAATPATVSEEARSGPPAPKAATDKREPRFTGTVPKGENEVKAAEPVEDTSAQRKSLLDRIFGSR